MLVFLGGEQSLAHDQLAQATLPARDGARKVVAGRVPDAFNQRGERRGAVVHVGVTLLVVGDDAGHARARQNPARGGE